MKILCLHGYTQNGPLFARKASAIRKLLAKNGHETVFIDAPIKVDKSELSYSTEDNKDMRSWWRFDPSSPEFYNMDLAFETVKRAVEQHGPFEGVLGFSQGAGLAGLLCSSWTQLMPHEPPLKLGIFYAGFIVEKATYSKLPIEIPTLHILGTQDTIVVEERSNKLYESCKDTSRNLLKHPGGHFVPSKKEFVEPVVAFVNDPLRNFGHSSGEEDDDWDAFDGIGGN